MFSYVKLCLKFFLFSSFHQDLYVLLFCPLLVMKVLSFRAFLVFSVLCPVLRYKNIKAMVLLDYKEVSICFTQEITYTRIIIYNDIKRNVQIESS